MLTNRKNIGGLPIIALLFFLWDFPPEFPSTESPLFPSVGPFGSSFNTRGCSMENANDFLEILWRIEP